LLYSFYENCGFEKTGTEQRTLGDGKEYQTYVMERAV